MPYPCIKEEDMTYQEILKTYKKMGIGTQELRNQLLQWSTETNNENGHLVFIIESPNSKTLKEEDNAQLARNLK
jgi:hypothetical protein